MLDVRSVPSAPGVPIPGVGPATTGVVLVVDADDELSALRDTPLADDVEFHSCDSDHAADRARHLGVDVVLLRIGAQGLAPVRRLRGVSDVGLLTVGAAASARARAATLDAGADDHLDDPYDLCELSARLRALLRRCSARRRALQVHGPGPELVVDTVAREVRRGGRQVHLTGTELRLLETLIGSPGILLSHEDLLAQVWGEGYHDEVHYVRVYVGQLRRKLGDDANAPHLVQTVPGVGYRWIATTSVAS